uniref:Vps72/YL1 N-terminal domain-containing protein n=1 Tax=Panagrolaimus superbus TaxID=310955 RepID=A0A914YHJ6_9BILA
MPRPAPRTRKRKIEEVEEQHRERELSEDIFDTPEKTNDESSNESSNDNDGSSSDEFEFESLAATRSRRSAAGTKMQELIEQQKEKDAKEMVQSEEVYKDFFEVENDEDFEADDGYLKSESEVDSDFDEDEADDDPEDVGEQQLRNERLTETSTNTDKARKKRERMMKELATSLLVEDNVVDDRTHARYIKEAKLVAKKNQEDLRRIELELEKQRNETLEFLRPKNRIERTDVIRTKEYFDENGERIRQIFIPNDSIHVWQPSEIWLSQQHLMSPKPSDFDKLSPEKV